MEVALKVGNGGYPSDANFNKNWLDGQIIDIRPDGFHKGKLSRTHHCILTFPGDFWKIRGTTDWKSTKHSIYENIKKYLVAVDSEGKYPWEREKKLVEVRVRRRDWYIDFQALLKDGFLTPGQIEGIYNRDKDPGMIFIDRAFDQIVRHEDQNPRLKFMKNVGISTGTFSIGSGLDYDTVTLFEAAIITQGDGPLTGNLIGEHNDEETTISSDVDFDVDTATYLLKLTAQSGDKHNGSYGHATYEAGDGARVSMGSSDSIQFTESVAGKMDDIEVSDLVIDITGSANDGIRAQNGGDDGMWTIQRNVIFGGSSSDVGIQINNGCTNITVINNIVSDADQTGICSNGAQDAGNTVYIANNTVINCYRGIQQEDSSLIEGTFTLKNNLVQNSDIADYFDAGAGFGTTARNVSEDATSPDVAYRTLNCHDGNSCFLDYPNDDYRLDSGGDEISTLDDGDDLSGVFTDDIIGQTRSTWYIGAYEIVGGQIYELSTTINGQTATPSIDTQISRAISAAINAGTSTPASDLQIARALAATINASTSTSAIDLLKTIGMAAQIAAVSSTPAVALDVVRFLLSSISGQTSLSQIIFQVIRALASAIDAQTITSDIALEIFLALSTQIEAQTTTPSISAQIERAISSAIAGQTSTPAPELEIQRSLESQIDAVIVTSEIELLISGIIELATTIAAQTQTSSASLILERFLQAVINAQSVTPAIDTAITRPLQAAIDGETLTPDILLSVIRELSAQIQASSATASIAIQITRALTAQINAGTSLSEALVTVLREFSALVDSVTLTSAIDLIVGGLGLIADTELISMTARRRVKSKTADREAKSKTARRTIEPI